jgi:undecaprenyl-diphosphatase
VAPFRLFAFSLRPNSFLMAIWLIAIVLGLVEGITEFIPVSSTGHLLLAEQFLGITEASFFHSEVFNAVIQCGAVLAALPLFADRLRSFEQWREKPVQDYIVKLGVAFCITAVGGITYKKLGYQLPHSAFPVAMALLIGGVAFLFVESWIRHKEGSKDITWTLAIVFGLAQIVAVAFPGASRSGSTIIFALLLGLARGPATEFSFLLGVPTLCAAGAKTLLDAHKEHVVILWGPLILASVIAAIASFIAVGWLLRYVQSHTFIGFGLYRIFVGSALLVLWFFNFVA